MRKKTDREFWESAVMNNWSYQNYYTRITELALSRFEWLNLPDSIDARYMELALYSDGMAVFFYDDVLGHLCLRCAIGGKFNVYRIPTVRRAYALNGYMQELDDTNSVLIYNNMIRTSSKSETEIFARRMYELDRAIDVNAKAQKTPILIQCAENEVLSMRNLYMKYDGNTPIIIGDKQLGDNPLKAIQTGAPYVADRLYDLKTKLWNECLTYLGIPNLSIDKKERLIVDEVDRNQGGVIASRGSALMARKQACEQINKMFGLNIDVRFRADIMGVDE